MSFMFGRGDKASGSSVAAVNAAGTAFATATALTAMVNNVTTAAGEVGVKLPQNHAQGSPVVVSNVGTTTLAINVYPPTTAGAVNGTTVVTVAADKAAACFAHPNGLDYTVVGG